VSVGGGNSNNDGVFESNSAASFVEFMAAKVDVVDAVVPANADTGVCNI
jgi:hypothetical protein